MKNITVYIVVPLIAVAVGAFIFLNGKPETEPVVTGEEEIVLAATTAARNETGGNYTIEMRYPQFGDPAIDTQIVAAVDEAIATFKVAASASTPMEGIPYSLESEFDSVYIGPDVVATRLIISEYTGGAHPLELYVGLNYDRATGRQLILTDALQMIGKFVSEVSATAIAQLQAEHGESLFAEGANTNPENFSSFIVSADKVTFIFQPYQVAAYAAGPQEVSFARQ